MQEQTVCNPFHLMIKPVGAACNLACRYCYYLDKSSLYPNSSLRMDLNTLDDVLSAYLQSSPPGVVTVGWQGGEPLIAGREFFARAVELERKHLRPGQSVLNTIQTNGTLLDDAWAEFFASNGFLVGISIDGTQEMHDEFRRDSRGGASYGRVMEGLEHLQRHNVDVNALITVNRRNIDYPLEVYSHLVGLGLNHLQFIPIVERRSLSSRKVTGFSAGPIRFGRFLCEIFDHWAANDIGKVFVGLFESALAVCMGGLPSVCVHAPTCGRALVVEHNGDLYACDHFVYPQYLRGKATGELAALVDGADQRAFGAAKADLSSDCRSCEVLAFCGGDCPKHRLNEGADGKPVSHICASYREFFNHSRPVLERIAEAIRRHGSL